MNRNEVNSFQMQEIEIETLREQLKKEQSQHSLLKKAFVFLSGEVIGKDLNTTHPYYPYYKQYIDTITSNQ